VSYTLTWEPRGILRAFHGRVGAAEFVRAQGEMYGDPRFEDAHYALIDLSAATELVCTPADVEEITASNRGAFLTNPHLRVAVVTTDAQMQSLLERMAEVSAYPLRVFPTLAEARRWAMAG